MFKIEISDEANFDIIESTKFYNFKQTGLGNRFFKYSAGFIQFN